ncbi:uncharacterized protein LOC134210015 [Armigeres subalbatus]|uniref:uncharacterized protein LOC134210015 n=1 Tax=Armigeres subalbatus TaxID=124917 RepID=UPI002ED63A7F
MSYVAQIFDPLGLVGPTVAKAKLFMQCLWALKTPNNERYEWDQPLPPKLQQQWKEFHTTIDLLREVRVPRFTSVIDAVSIELHFFADASNKAYGTCCYVRAQSTSEVGVKLLASKSKLSPLAARHTIARLELCAAHLSTQLYKKVASSLKTVPPAFFWSDSTTVIQWLRSSPGRWKTFVANRVSQIQATTTIERWNHVAGSDNPADDISRGLDPADLLNKTRWWNGPSWLKLSPDQWPAGITSAAESSEVTHETRKIPIVAMTSVHLSFNDELFSRYSSFSALRRTVAWSLRYLQALRDRAIARRCFPEKINKPALSKSATTPLNSEELQSADRMLCRLAQRESFPEEHSDLSAGMLVSKCSPLKWLKAYIDEFELIRVGGRLHNADLSEQTKHPIVLCAKHPLARLLAVQYHNTLLHAGPQLMLASLRQKFWILGARNLVRGVYHQCITCFRSKSNLIQQTVADLPVSRVTPTRPFSGASHAPHQVYRMLKQDNEDRNQIFSWCANNEIRWKFIPARAPHFGGLWEAAVKSAKTHLLKEIGKTSLSYEDLLTLLAQVEMCLNSRPVTPLSSEPTDLEALTPGHFLVGSNLQAVPEFSSSNVPKNRLEHYEQTQRHPQRIWSRWYPEYLQQLQSRAMQGCQTPNRVKTGQIVVIKDDCLPLAQWPTQ